MHLSACRTILAVSAAVVSGGCAINAEPDFDSAVPQDRFLAIREAKASGDESALPNLVRQLASDDALMRVAAIDALETITGETRGFRPHDREVERRRAIDRWTTWLKTHQEAAK
ncbi:MAG: hypothetical protein AAFR76_10785 [Planctomycetota bacterium]